MNIDNTKVTADVIGATRIGTPIFRSEESGNKSFAIFGLSGMGKTLLLLLLTLIRMRAGELVIWLGFRNNNDFSKMPQEIVSVYEQNVRRIDTDKILPIPWIDEGETLDMSYANHIAHDLAHAFHLPKTREASVAIGIKTLIKKNQLLISGLDTLEHALEIQEDASSKAALATISCFLDATHVRNTGIAGILNEKIIEYDFTKLPTNEQIPAAELLLEAVYRQIEKGKIGNRNITVVIDEAQELTFNNGSALANIMKLGRKMGISALLATVASPLDSKSCPAQAAKYCGTNLYFRPDPLDCKKLARTLDKYRVAEYTSDLKELERGEIMAVGALIDENGNKQSSPMILNAPLDYVMKRIKEDKVQHAPKNDNKD